MKLDTNLMNIYDTKSTLDIYLMKRASFPSIFLVAPRALFAISGSFFLLPVYARVTFMSNNFYYTRFILKIFMFS